jgi:hypothetical protein
MDCYNAAEETIVTTTSDDLSIQDMVRRIVKAAGNNNAKAADAESLAK